VSHVRTKLIAVTLLLLPAAHALAEPAIVQSKLNLRAGPGPAFPVLAVLPAGTKLSTQKCGDEWCRVSFGRQPGYVSREFLKFGNDSYASVAPQLEPVQAKPTLGGPHVWQWNDRESRDRNWRRLEWHNRMNRR